MARTKSATAKAKDAELFVQLYPQCTGAVEALEMFGFGPEHADAILGKGGIRERFNGLAGEEQANVAGASAVIAEHWQEFLKKGDIRDKNPEMFVQMYPQCAEAVNTLQMFNFGAGQADAILAAGEVTQRLNRLTDRQQEKVKEASAVVANHWPEFLHEKDFMKKDLAGLDKTLPEGWTLEDTASPREKAAQQAANQSNSASGTSRLPTAGQAAVAAAGLAAAGGAVASWRDREQMRNAPQQDAAKSQGKLAKTLAFAAGAAVLLGGAFYAYNRSQGQGVSR